MDEKTEMQPGQKRRRLRQRLQSLQRAGVTHLPRILPDAAENTVPDAVARGHEGAAGRPVAPSGNVAGPVQRGSRPVPAPVEAVAAKALTASLFDAIEQVDAVPPAQRPEVLNQMAGEVAACTRCSALVECRSRTVFGVGSHVAQLCFVGEAPGQEEDRQGEPFVGPAGQLLNRIITACRLRREDVYICNVLKCRPPGNRNPLPDEVANCMPFLERQLQILRPRFLCALGGVAAQALLETNLSIGRLRGRVHAYRGTPVVCTYHPAYLLRNPNAKSLVWDDMKMLMARMGVQL